jgi:hypothetical protein
MRKIILAVIAAASLFTGPVAANASVTNTSTATQKSVQYSNYRTYRRVRVNPVLVQRLKVATWRLAQATWRLRHTLHTRYVHPRYQGPRVRVTYYRHSPLLWRRSG